MNPDLDGKAIRKVTLRLPVHLYLSIDDKARLARKPLAAVIRAMLEDREVKAAPPLVAELSEEAQYILKIVPSLLANLQQLSLHAERLGGVFLRLIEPDGGLKKLADQARLVGFTLKKGEPLAHPLTSKSAISLGEACAQVNELAYALNGPKGAEVLPSDWMGPLNSLAAALEAL
jgi:hypothetical protein